LAVAVVEAVPVLKMRVIRAAEIKMPKINATQTKAAETNAMVTATPAIKVYHGLTEVQGHHAAATTHPVRRLAVVKAMRIKIPMHDLGVVKDNADNQGPIAVPADNPKAKVPKAKVPRAKVPRAKVPRAKVPRANQGLPVDSVMASVAVNAATTIADLDAALERQNLIASKARPKQNRLPMRCKRERSLCDPSET
jgi:hypothetical protein